jgi:hypothetical protein
MIHFCAWFQQRKLRGNFSRVEFSGNYDPNPNLDSVPTGHRSLLDRCEQYITWPGGKKVQPTAGVHFGIRENVPGVS